MIEPANNKEVLKDKAQWLSDFADSEEGKAIEGKFFEKIKKERATLSKKKQYYDSLSSEEFRGILDRQIDLHGPKWIDKCYKRGVEPYSKGELQTIIAVMEEYGRNRIPKKWDMFASYYKTYKGFRLVRFDGQGTFFRIYRFKQLLIQI